MKSFTLLSLLHTAVYARTGPIRDVLLGATSTASSALSAATGDYVDIQVYPPVLTPFNTFTNSTSILPILPRSQQSCSFQQVLMTHSFANSYYDPFVGDYAPPTCSFNRVTLEMTTVVDGVQFDRLGSVYLGSVEIWRTTTGEPAGDPPTTYTYIKDVSAYLALLSTDQKLIMELNNVVDSTYTGIYNVTITATFFNSQDTIEPADQIIPVNLDVGLQGKASIWSVPNDIPTQLVTLPQNAKKASFVVSATGQIDEEFWYTNYLSSETETFGSPPSNGFSPYREVQVLIDSHIAGVVLPFPIIFSGGINPDLWRPMLGIDAFDLRMDEIDITPWLPLLCDGAAHNFTLAVAGISDNGDLTNLKGSVVPGVGSFWLLSGTIFIWQDPSGYVTTGSNPLSSYSAPDPVVELSSSILQDPTGNNYSLGYDVGVTRKVSVSSVVKTSEGAVQKSWMQSLSYSYQGNVNAEGLVQSLSQRSHGVDTASSAGESMYTREIDYPLFLNFTLGAVYINRTQVINIAGEPVLPSGLQPFDRAVGYPTHQNSNLSTTQNAFQIGVAGVESTGQTVQSLHFEGSQVGSDGKTESENYSEYANAVNGMLLQDVKVLGTSTASSAASGLVPTSFPAANSLLKGRSPFRKAK